MNIVVDIDGTLLDISHRLKHIKKKTKDWDSFYADCVNDKPIRSICTLVDNLANNYRIIFCTGRSDKIRNETILSLSKTFGVDFTDYPALFMRKEGDRRPDTIVKPELLANNNITPENTEFILEDRSSVVNKLRSLGFTVLQVADGNF